MRDTRLVKYKLCELHGLLFSPSRIYLPYSDSILNNL